MKRHLLVILMCLPVAAIWSGSRPAEIPFEKHTIDLGASETCAFADINGDGRLDIVSGEYWYEAPKWTPHRFRELDFTNGYIDIFSDLPMDVDGDGRPDVVSCEFFGKRLRWYRNPGKTAGLWKEQLIDSGFSGEFAFLVDLDNDGKAREVLPNYLDKNAPLAWYEPKNGAFVKHVISPKSMGHGIGVGDINGDGRNDVITPQGWFEAPPDPRAGEWTFHADFKLGTTGFIYTLDINGDGRNDIVTSLAHDYGLLWFEQGVGSQWTRHVIDDTYSQAHALTLVDLNGDGRNELLTAKRYMAHDHDPGAREPLGVYWYEYRKSSDGKTVEWIKHVIDYSTRAGGGMQIPVADIDGDGDLDFAAGGKSGLFLFENLTKSAPRARQGGKK